MEDSNNIVSAGTRRAVGYATLRRLSRMAGDWHTEARENSRLAAGLMATVAIIGFTGATFVFWF